MRRARIVSLCFSYSVVTSVSAATLACSSQGLAPSPEEFIPAPILTSVSTGEVAVGDEIAFGVEQALPSRSGWIDLHAEGKFTATDGEVYDVDYRVPLSPDPSGRIVWERFGAIDIPFGPGDKAGVFEGLVYAVNRLYDGRVKVQPENTRSLLTLKVEPSIVITTFAAIDQEGQLRACQEPIAHAIGGARYIIGARAVGFEPTAATFTLSSGWLKDGDAQSENGVFTAPVEAGLDSGITFIPAEVPPLVTNYHMTVTIHMLDTNGVAHMLKYPFVVHREVEVDWDDDWEIAEIYEAEQVTGCYSGDTTGMQVGYTETRVDIRTRSMSTSTGRGWQEMYSQSHQQSRSRSEINGQSSTQSRSVGLSTTESLSGAVGLVLNQSGAAGTTLSQSVRDAINGGQSNSNGRFTTASRVDTDTNATFNQTATPEGTTLNDRSVSDFNNSVNQFNNTENVNGQENKQLTGNDTQVGINGGVKIPLPFLDGVNLGANGGQTFFERTNAGTEGETNKVNGSGSDSSRRQVYESSLSTPVDVRTTTDGSTASSTDTNNRGGGTTNNQTLTNSRVHGFVNAFGLNQVAAEALARNANLGMLHSTTSSEINSFSTSQFVAQSQSYSEAVTTSAALATSANEVFSEGLQVSSLDGVSYTANNWVWPHELAAFFRQTIRKVRSGAMLKYDLCGNATLIGEVQGHDYVWGVGLGRGKTCPPQHFLEPAQCRIPPCDGGR